MKYITITEAMLDQQDAKDPINFRLAKRRLYLGGCAFFVEDFKYSKEEEEMMKKLDIELNNKYHSGNLKNRSSVELYKKLLVSNAIIKVLDGSSKIGRWFYVKETQEEIYKMLDNA